MTLLVWSMLAMAAAPAAQHQGQGTVCLAIDEARDTFSDRDRRAAVILMAREFERAGRQVAPDGCTDRYTLSHVRLGDTITVTLTGPPGQREGRAIGMDDLAGLYSQNVRAILSGSSVGAMDVVDRTNVTTPQTGPKRMGIDSFGYARLGYGRVMGGGGSGNPAIGFGYRAEMDSFGLDISFLNNQLPSSGDFGSSYFMSASLLQL